MSQNPLDTFFLPYQKRWINDKSRKRLIEKSRQIGISLSTAFDLVMKTSPVENRHDAWVSSRDDLQAQLFGNDCANWARIMEQPCGEVGERVVNQTEKISAHVLPFQNGRSIYSLSSNPNAQAGKRGRRVFDEFALNPDNRLLYSIGQPGTLWGGGMDIISTHRGTANFFNDLITEIKHKGNPKGFSLHTVTIMDAVRDGLLEKLKAKWAEADPGDERLKWAADDFLQSIRNECADEETWLQEFMCVPGDDNAAFLSFDLISGCLYQFGVPWESFTETGRGILIPTGPLYIGVDIGRKRDLTVIWIIEKILDMSYTRGVICLEKTPFSRQRDILYPIIEHPLVRRCCIDNTGIGMQFAEEAKQKYGNTRIEEVTFSGPVKEELAFPVKAAFEDKTVRVPDEKFIISDLRKIRKTTTAAGNVRFEGERDKDGHADRFWGLALALHAAKTAKSDFFAAVC